MADKNYNFRMISVKLPEYRRFQTLRNELKISNSQTLDLLLTVFYRYHTQGMSKHKESEE